MNTAPSDRMNKARRRLKQEILLGIGGILTLKKLGIKKDV